ncbi:MAG: hypothetical protein WDA60_07780 [Acidimicrobiia bacterium]
MRRPIPGLVAPGPVAVVIALTALVMVLATSLPIGPGAATRADAALKCPKPPLTVRIQPSQTGANTPADLRVTDVVARRVPIVPRPFGATSDAKTLARLRAKAADTSLALYTLYLADFAVPRADLTGSGFGEVTAPAGKTVATMTIVPTRKTGFEDGDVVQAEPFRYESTTTFAPLSLTVSTSGDRSLSAYDAVRGDVEIRELGPTVICLDMDVTFTRGRQPVASIIGTARAPVVRSADSFFYT